MPKRRSEDDDDWSECAAHTGHMMQGHISDLRQIEPKGRPFTKRYAPLGFCIDPEAYRVKPKRRKRK